MAARGERTPDDDTTKDERVALRSDITELGAGRTVSDVAPRFRPSDIVPRSAALTPSLPPPSSGPLPLDDALLAQIHQCFGNLAGPESVLDSAKLKRSLDVESVFIAERVLSVFDRNRDGLVNRVEFVRGVPRLLFGSLRDKLRFAFRLHDLDSDGAVDRGELARMLELGLTEDGVPAPSRRRATLERPLARSRRQNGDGKLSFSEFETIATSHPDATALIFRSEASWIAPRGELSERPGPRPEPRPALLTFRGQSPRARGRGHALGACERRALHECRPRIRSARQKRAHPSRAWAAEPASI